MNQFTAILILRAQDKTVENFLHLDHHNRKKFEQDTSDQPQRAGLLIQSPILPFFQKFYWHLTDV